MEVDLMRIDGVAHLPEVEVSLVYRDIVSPAPSIAGTVHRVSSSDDQGLNRVVAIDLTFTNTFTTQCVRDQLVALATIGRAFPLQIDRDWFFERQRLIRVSANVYRTELAPIRPPGTDSGTSPANYLWDSDDPYLVYVDGVPFTATVDWRTGLVVFADDLEGAPVVELTYCYTPVVVVLPDEIQLVPNPDVTVEQPGSGFDFFADNAPVYTGSVRVRPVFPADETLRRRPSYSGCFEFGEGEGWEEDDILPVNPPAVLFPPFPEPSVAFRDIYAPGTRWDTVRSSPNYTTSSLSGDIPLGNVIAGVEIHKAKGLTWGRSSSNTLRILASYRLNQAIPVTRTFTKGSQPGGVYDHAVLNLVDLLPRTVMGSYYDEEWPNRFGRATSADHRGTISGALEIQAPDLTTNTQHPLEEAGSVVSGKSSAFWRDPPDGILIYTTPNRHIQTFMDLTQGRYWLSAAWRFTESRPGIGVMPISGPTEPAWDLGYTYGAMKNLPLAQETYTVADISAAPKIWWRGESEAPSQQVYIRAFSVVRSDLFPSGPASPNDFVRTTGATGPSSSPVIARVDNTLEDRLNDTGWVAGGFSGAMASVSSSGGGFSRRVHPTNTVPPTNTSSGVGLYVGGAVEIWDHFAESKVAVYHGPPVVSNPDIPQTISVSGAVALSLGTNTFGQQIITLTGTSGGSGFLQLANFSGFTNPVPDLWVCGWILQLRALARGAAMSPIPLTAQIIRDAGGVHTAAPLSIGSAPLGNYASLGRGGVRDVWNHDQTTVAFWRANQQSGLRVRVHFTLAPGEIVQVLAPLMQWAAVPKPSRSVTAEYTV